MDVVVGSRATTDARALLDRGELIPPTDDITANGLEIWENNEPLYHDLSCIPYTKFDVQEWTGKIRKFKAETVRYANQCRLLEKQVAKLQEELGRSTGDFEDIEARIHTADAKTTALVEMLQEETTRRNTAVAECVQLRRAKDQLVKQTDVICKDISQARNRIGLLKTEVERNRARHQAALGEKERLKLERRWFFHERLLLEETTGIEIGDVALMKEKLDKLRHCMHQAWKDTKEMDLLGHLRATKRSPINEEWFAARRRAYHQPSHFETQTPASTE